MLQKVGPMEIALIVIVVLLIFGPAKLPQLGKSVGDTIKEFRNSMKSVREDEPAADAKATEAESGEQKKA